MKQKTLDIFKSVFDFTDNEKLRLEHMVSEASRKDKLLSDTLTAVSWEHSHKQAYSSRDTCVKSSTDYLREKARTFIEDFALEA